MPSSPADGLKGRAVVGDHPTPNLNRIGIRDLDTNNAANQLIGSRAFKRNPARWGWASQFIYLAWPNNFTVREIAHTLDWDEQRVWNRKSALGLPNRPRLRWLWSDKKQETLEFLVGEGESIERIAVHMGKHRSTIAAHLRKHDPGKLRQALKRERYSGGGISGFDNFYKKTYAAVRKGAGGG